MRRDARDDKIFFTCLLFSEDGGFEDILRR